MLTDKIPRCRCLREHCANHGPREACTQEAVEFIFYDVDVNTSTPKTNRRVGLCAECAEAAADELAS
jgi:hypothetical protein